MAGELLSRLTLPSIPFSLALPLLLTTLAALLLLRLLLVLQSVGRAHSKRRPGERLSTLVVLGSGGHTAEMLNQVRSLSPVRYCPRCYVAAATDGISLQKARGVEDELAKAASTAASAAASSAPSCTAPPSFLSVYRSREVGQSFVTSVPTTLAATLHAMTIVATVRPDLILCNGPGTCLPICVAAFALHVVGIKRSSIVFVESVARVEHLSLTGRLLHLMGISDRFFVQWPQLTSLYQRTQYVGRLM